MERKIGDLENKKVSEWRLCAYNQHPDTFLFWLKRKYLSRSKKLLYYFFDKFRSDIQIFADNLDFPAIFQHALCIWSEGSAWFGWIRQRYGISKFAEKLQQCFRKVHSHSSMIKEQRQLLQGKKLQQLPLFHKNNFYSSSRNVSGVFFSSFLNTLQK